MSKIRLLPQGVPLISVTDDYTANLTNQVIAADASVVNPLIVQLPQVGASRSFEIVVANVGASGTVTIDAFGSEEISGSLTYDLTAEWDAVTLTSVPGGWALSSGGGGGGPIAFDDLTDVTITTPSLFDTPFYDDATSEWVNLRGQRANTQYHGGFFGLTGDYTIADGTSFLAVVGSMDAGAGEDTVTLSDAVLNAGQMLTIINLTDAGGPGHNITIQCAGTDIFPSGLSSLELGVGSVIEFSGLGAVGPFTVWIPGIRSGFDYDIPYFNGLGISDGKVVMMTATGTTPSWQSGNGIEFTPSTSGDWSTVPATVGEAFDTLAADLDANKPLITLSPLSAAPWTPTPNVNENWGGTPRVPDTTAGRHRMYVPQSGVISRADIYAHIAGTAGTSEGWILYIAHNGTDYTIATVSSTATHRVWSGNPNVTVTQGDYIELRFGNPNWATPPTDIYLGGSILIET